MDIKHLRYFVQVVEMGSISKAAAALSVAQPAINRQILNLEASLGGQLLHRNGRGVSTTEAGDILFERAKGILEDFRRTESERHEMTGMPQGRLLLVFLQLSVRLLLFLSSSDCATTTPT